MFSFVLDTTNAEVMSSVLRRPKAVVARWRGDRRLCSASIDFKWEPKYAPRQ